MKSTNQTRRISLQIKFHKLHSKNSNYTQFKKEANKMNQIVTKLIQKRKEWFIHSIKKFHSFTQIKLMNDKYFYFYFNKNINRLLFLQLTHLFLKVNFFYLKVIYLKFYPSYEFVLKEIQSLLRFFVQVQVNWKYLFYSQ